MRYVCTVCGYIYDESQNTPWAALPEDWKCPLCGAAKSDFKPESADSVQPVPVADVTGEELRPLSNLELSALCSNLAKGCEKQCLEYQAASFFRLAEWFQEHSDGPADPSFDAVLKKIEQDLESGFPAANAVSAQKEDRGALRALVWSEKVTRILRSLLTRFSNEPLPEETGVYVCTICGFVYVGDDLPEVCPVCKVPNRKFEKIGG